ncbi:MAG TPA: sulfotransferase [Gammaproteobacteria bacterium]|nr:sulfotransferase [Gammaproteobacteria bacterium]
MTLKVIGAGLGRTATFSLKFALEHLGLGPCYHMAEVFAGLRRNVPLWLEVVRGKPDWDAVFAGFQSTTDYPACTYWRELTAFYPDAKVILTVRDADSWFDSVSETIFSPQMQGSLAGSPVGAMMQGVIFDTFGDRVTDRAFMTDWFTRRNQTVIDSLPPDQLLVFSPKQGWEPLCAFLGVPVPDAPFPRVNSRDELKQATADRGGLPPDPETAEKFARIHIGQMKAKAFGTAV